MDHLKCKEVTWRIRKQEPRQGHRTQVNGLRGLQCDIAGHWHLEFVFTRDCDVDGRVVCWVCLPPEGECVSDQGHGRVNEGCATVG